MPITKRAIKKLRHDRKRAVQNNSVRKSLKKVIMLMRKHPTAKTFTVAQVALDKAAKHRVIHPNRAARLKSRLAKLLH